LHVTILETLREDPKLAASWNDLAMRMERPEVFYTYQWALAASNAFAGTLRPLVCLVYDSDQLCGVAALATSPDRCSNAFFLASSTADYCDFLSEPDMRKGVMEAIFAEIRKLGVRELVLTSIPAESSTLRELPGIAESYNFHLHERAAADCGVILLGNDQERHAILRSMKRKEKEGRALKKMAQAGSVHVTHLMEPTQTDLTPIFSAQISRFLATHRVSPLLRPERRSFLVELSRLLGHAGWLKISRLEIDGEPIAWNYGFLFCSSWFWYLPTFEIDRERLSPGSCLLRLLVEEGCEDASVDRLDLGLGDEPYKERYTNAVFPTRYVQLSSGIFRHQRVVGRHRLSEMVQRFPRLENKTRALRDISRALQSRIRTAGLLPTTAYAFERLAKKVASEVEILLFEAPEIETPPPLNVTLIPLNWKVLADAAMGNTEDVSTLEYLMRCAARMRTRASCGFVLRTQGGQAGHFLWIDRYDGFHLSEIDYKLESPDPGAAMIYDCWTPVSQRGNGYYAIAIRLAAESLQQQRRRAWIFSAAKNVSSVRGIRKADFEYRFSLVRKSALSRSSVTRADSAGAL
jgi:CelD/BcsL family acetyltransferase involved in cellulose biosynthesis